MTFSPVHHLVFTDDDKMAKLNYILLQQAYWLNLFIFTAFKLVFLSSLLYLAVSLWPPDTFQLMPFENLYTAVTKYALRAWVLSSIAGSTKWHLNDKQFMDKQSLYLRPKLWKKVDCFRQMSKVNESMRWVFVAAGWFFIVLYCPSFCTPGHLCGNQKRDTLKQGWFFNGVVFWSSHFQFQLDSYSVSDGRWYHNNDGHGGNYCFAAF